MLFLYIFKDTLKLHGDIRRTGKDDCMVYHFTGDGLQFCTLKGILQ
jgi:hypothetical protein